MCGILGFDGEFDKPLLLSGLRALRHRGPDNYSVSHCVFCFASALNPAVECFAVKERFESLLCLVSAGENRHRCGHQDKQDRQSRDWESESRQSLHSFSPLDEIVRPPRCSSDIQTLESVRVIVLVTDYGRKFEG